MLNFLQIKKSVQDIADTVAKLRANIEALQRKREDVINAPVAKDDIKKAMVEMVKSRADAFEQSLRFALQPLVRKPHMTANPQQVDQYLTLMNSTFYKDGNIASGKSADIAVCGLFNSLVADAMSKAIDKMEWPEGALPIAGRERTVQDLDVQLSKLTKEEADLVSSARSAGLVFE